MFCKNCGKEQWNEQTYYHFLSSKDAIDDLENERIKISVINELNDPFELLPYIRYKESKTRQRYLDIRNEVSKKYGLLCFSKIWEEPLLWGHYAEKHKGVAIGFEILEDEILRVEYSPELKRTKFELANSKEENEKLFIELAKTKSEKWSYEKEYRILVKLNECEPEHIKGEEYLFLKFHNRLKVKEIILGSFFDKDKCDKIIELTEKFEAKIKATRLEWQGYKINKCGRTTNKLNEKLNLLKTKLKP